MAAGGRNTTPSASLSASPTTVSRELQSTASWNGIAAPTTTDWIGLYAPGAADTNFINWIYVSCSTIAGTARASGSCSYLLPATLSAGNYELRLFANDGFTRLATTSSFTVTVGGTTSPTLTVSPTTVKARDYTYRYAGVESPLPPQRTGSGFMHRAPLTQSSSTGST